MDRRSSCVSTLATAMARGAASAVAPADVGRPQATADAVEATTTMYNSRETLMNN
jgi:hypothetical protein